MWIFQEDIYSGVVTENACQWESKGYPEYCQCQSTLNKYIKQSILFFIYKMSKYFHDIEFSILVEYHSNQISALEDQVSDAGSEEN